MKQEPLIHVGILTDHQIAFRLCGDFRASAMGADGQVSHWDTATGDQSAQVMAESGVAWSDGEWSSVEFTPTDAATCTFVLHHVVIGIGFHWERREEQRFAGSLRLIANRGSLMAINVVPAETYLTSVISSEMSAHASAELLKAHAVISRSWLMNILGKWEQGRPDERELQSNSTKPAQQDELSAEGSARHFVLKWYDSTAHTLFHVCADDHCQRYQGLTRIIEKARQAVDDTRGEVLTYDGHVCDARFSKCCGGAMEEFATCWADRDVPYLHHGFDCAQPPQPAPDLTHEPEAADWIGRAPDAFCHTRDARILRQVLNNYDQETTNFYRWTVDYTSEELSDIVRQRTGIDLGTITDLVPLQRGPSGRIYLLRIVGTRGELTVGKELEIRRTLSRSHLYSSAFTIERLMSSADDATALPAGFRLHGAGWGHGVGLCQIGAAVMGEQGYDYRQILHHYYAGAEVEAIYP